MSYSYKTIFFLAQYFLFKAQYIFLGVREKLLVARKTILRHEKYCFRHHCVLRKKFLASEIISVGIPSLSLSQAQLPNLLLSIKQATYP